MRQRGRQSGQPTIDEIAARNSPQVSPKKTLVGYKMPLFVIFFILSIVWFMNNTIKHDKIKQPMTLPSIAADQHLFDCHRPNATCHPFFPLQFFAQHQPGYKYLPQLHEMGASLPNLPRMTHFHWNNETTQLHVATTTTTTTHFGYLPTDITYLHMRKTGGTTIHHAIGHLSKYIVQSGATSLVTRYTTCRGVLRRQCQQDALLHTQRLYQSKQIVFAVVRDPISRFLSAMGQAMDVGLRLRRKCLDETSTTTTTTIECVLQHLQQYGLKSDVHFCPMAVNLYVIMRNMNIEVALFPQSELQNILEYLGGSNIHLRNRSNQDYLKSELLSKLSVQDLQPEMIRVICQLYAVDVEMMQSIGLNVPLCV